MYSQPSLMIDMLAVRPLPLGQCLKPSRTAQARGPRSARALTALGVFATLTAAQLAFADPAAAQVRGATQPKEDPRRHGSGAKITTEVDAEDKAKNRADSERLHDSYQPKGVDFGQFLFLPKIELDETYNTNLFATQTDERGDFVTTIRPELKLRSRFKEHALNLSLLAEQYLHRRFTRDNRTDMQLDVDGRYDFSSDTQANYFGQLFSRHEDRGSPDDVRGLEPTPIRGFVNRGGFKHQFGRYTVLSEIGVDRRVFGNVSTAAGTTIRNGDRDRWELLARLRGSYEMFPGYAAVAEVSGNRRRYDDALDRSGFDRNSYGYRVESGVGVDLSQLVRGDFLVGYFAQNYRDARFKDPQGLSVRATFNWTPTTLTIVVPSFERSVNETTTQNASGMVRNAFSLTVRHELERNIILTGYGSVAYDQMSGVKNRDAWTYEGRARVIYAFTPELYTGAEVGHRNKRSQAETESFTQTTFMLRLGLQY